MPLPWLLGDLHAQKVSIIRASFPLVCSSLLSVQASGKAVFRQKVIQPLR